MPFMQNEQLPTFLPKTTLETAPSESFLVRFDPDAGNRKKKTEVNKNVYNKERSEKSTDLSADPITEYDYVKFYVDLSQVISAFLCKLISGKYGLYGSTKCALKEAQPDKKITEICKI